MEEKEIIEEKEKLILIANEKGMEILINAIKKG